MIDADYLKGLIDSLKQQEAEGIAKMHQARGAIQVAEALLAKVGEEAKEDEDAPAPEASV